MIFTVTISLMMQTRAQHTAENTVTMIDMTVIPGVSVMPASSRYQY